MNYYDYDQGFRAFREALARVSLDEVIALFRAPAPDGDEYGAIFYEEVAIEIQRRGEAGIAFLLDERPRVEADENRLRAVLSGITWPPVTHPEIEGILLSYLHDTRPLIVMDAVDGLWSIGATSAHDAVLALRDHPSQYVRGSVLRYLQHVFPEEAVPAMMQGLHDPDFIVRESAIDGLDELGIVAALPDIRPFVNDPHPHVRQAAEWAVNNLGEIARESEPDGQL